MAFITIFLENPPTNVRTWLAVFYQNGQAFYSNSDLSPSGGYGVSIPDYPVVFRCVVNFADGSQDYKDINTPFYLQDGGIYHFNWGGGYLGGISKRRIAEGFSQDSLNNYLNDLQSFPMGTPIDLTLKFNVPLLITAGYLNAADFVTRELVPLFNNVGITVDLPLSGWDTVNITGTVTGDFQRQTNPIMMAGLGVPWRYVAALIGLVAGAVALTLITHWVCEAWVTVARTNVDLANADNNLYNDAVASGMSPSDAANLVKYLNDNRSTPTQDLSSILKWAAIGIVAVVAVTNVLPALTKRKL
jgi:hypothetical protein